MQVEWGKNRMDEEDLQDGEGQKKVRQMNIKKKKERNVKAHFETGSNKYLHYII